MVIKYKSFPILYRFCSSYRSEFDDNFGSDTHVLAEKTSCDGSVMFFFSFFLHGRISLVMIIVIGWLKRLV